jgi:6-phospho-beta-glucosidase
VSSLLGGDGAVHEVDMRNSGTRAGLADDDVVEVPARVTEAGPEPLPQAPLAPELLGLVQHVTAYERLTAEAAVTRDPRTARMALLAHPLIGQLEQVDALVEPLLWSEAPV